MNRRSLVPWMLAVLVVVLAGTAPSVSACTVCYGETDNAYLRGAEHATLFLVGVTYTLLLGGVAVLVTLRRRARRRLAVTGAEASVSEQASAQPPRGA